MSLERMHRLFFLLTIFTEDGTSHNIINDTFVTCKGALKTTPLLLCRYFGKSSYFTRFTTHKFLRDKSGQNIEFLVERTKDEKIRVISTLRFGVLSDWSLRRPDRSWHNQVTEFWWNKYREERHWEMEWSPRTTRSDDEQRTGAGHWPFPIAIGVFLLVASPLWQSNDRCKSFYSDSYISPTFLISLDSLCSTKIVSVDFPRLAFVVSLTVFFKRLIGNMFNPPRWFECVDVSAALSKSRYLRCPSSSWNCPYWNIPARRRWNNWEVSPGCVVWDVWWFQWWRMKINDCSNWCTLRDSRSSLYSIRYLTCSENPTNACE